jgi:hypothetical protein
MVSKCRCARSIKGGEAIAPPDMKRANAVHLDDGVSQRSGEHTAPSGDESITARGQPAKACTVELLAQAKPPGALDYGDVFIHRMGVRGHDRAR